MICTSFPTALAQISALRLSAPVPPFSATAPVFPNLHLRRPLILPLPRIIIHHIALLFLGFLYLFLLFFLPRLSVFFWIACDVEAGGGAGVASKAGWGMFCAGRADGLVGSGRRGFPGRIPGGAARRLAQNVGSIRPSASATHLPSELTPAPCELFAVGERKAF